MKIGEYELMRPLNKGGMAQVFLANRRWPDGSTKACVIKMPRTSQAIDERARRMFMAEVELSMKLEHTNIVHVFDAGVHEGLPYFVMDYVAGKDLLQLMESLAGKNKSFDVETVAHIGREIAHALDYAHNLEIAGVAQRIVHRDIASKNVMISGQGGVLLTDFGIASSVSLESSSTYVKGTLPCMAPEHYIGFPTPKSDAFGLGTILWELLSMRPFRSEISDPDELRQAVQKGHVLPIERDRDDVPKVLAEVVEGLLVDNEPDRMGIPEVITRLEDFPSRRLRLRELIRDQFGQAARSSGQTKMVFQAPPELEQTMAVVKAAGSHQGVPTAPDLASAQAFEAAGGPPVVRASTSRVSRPASLKDEDPSAPSRETDAPLRRLPGLPTEERLGPPRGTEPQTSSDAPLGTRLLDKKTPPPQKVVSTELLPPPTWEDAAAREGDSGTPGQTPNENEPATAGDESVPSPPSLLIPKTGTASEDALDKEQLGPPEASASPAPEHPASSGHVAVWKPSAEAPEQAPQEQEPQSAPELRVHPATAPSGPSATEPVRVSDPTLAHFASGTIVEPRTSRSRVTLAIGGVVTATILGSVAAFFIIDEPEEPPAQQSDPAMVAGTKPSQLEPEPLSEPPASSFDEPQFPPVAPEPTEPSDHERLVDPEPENSGEPESEPDREPEIEKDPIGADPGQPSPTAEPPKPETASRERKKPEPKKQKVELVLVKFERGWVKQASIRVRRRTHELDGKLELRVPAGRQRIGWRLGPDSDWKSRPFVLKSDCEYFMTVEADGLRSSQDCEG